MKRTMKRSGTGGREQGYVLLTMMLFLTLILIAATAAAPKIAFEIKRDREEELIHRGVEYSRAIRKFAKRTGRYPTRLEELQETSGLRFIRRLYKDPITGGDFQLLHLGDIRPNTGVTNLNPANARNRGGNTAVDSNGDAGSDPNATPADPDASGGTSSPGTAAARANGNTSVATAGSPQVIFGVASPSKARTIREFNHKNHYNQWLFFYDPALDKGYQIKGPTTPFVPAPLGSQPNSDQAGQQPAQGIQPQ
jgi:type II secretory pathway pseudopilin PulG